MVAVVVKSGNGRAVRFRFVESLCLCHVGKKATARRVKKALKPFGDGYILSEDFDPSFRPCFSELSSRTLRESLFFNLLLKAASVGSFGKVGVVCTDTLTPVRVAELMRFVSELLLISEPLNDEFLCDCISRYGACPDTGSINELYTCDAVLSVDGLPHFDGLLFGFGGVSVCGDGLLQGEALNIASEFNVDPFKLFCLLSAEKGDKTDGLCPLVVSVKGEKMSCRAFLESLRKDLVVNFFDLV